MRQAVNRICVDADGISRLGVALTRQRSAPVDHARPILHIKLRHRGLEPFARLIRNRQRRAKRCGFNGDVRQRQRMLQFDPHLHIERLRRCTRHIEDQRTHLRA